MKDVTQQRPPREHDQLAPVAFAPEGAPRYVPDSDDPEHQPRPLEPDCCARRVCPQRDFARALSLAISHLNRAYAALWLVQDAIPAVWEEGAAAHGCGFADDLDLAYTVSREALELAVAGVFKSSVIPAFDLKGQWAGFTDAEIAGRVLTTPKYRAIMGAEARRELRRIVSDNDALECARWFDPPAPEGDRAS
jgi:hypothetical protein